MVIPYSPRKYFMSHKPLEIEHDDNKVYLRKNIHLIEKLNDNYVYILDEAVLTEDEYNTYRKELSDCEE